MNALTEKFRIATGKVVAPVFTCGCCKDVTAFEDHMSDDFGAEHTRAVRAAYGFNVCHACADDFEPAKAGEYNNPDETHDLRAEEA
ncbi:hypothetical protein [Leisingera methylohalidivorans]|uniref:Uncharacterized protein n=1 Tax=Leisingera methylohalidivorans DSM 14336 TaxID=999552 RepID=V9W191_9RHOB|nr:hypothetical protein [Leisingera methylohalidivorans]AHD02932.1 hypothetical protein METH_06725 [Leisingera methylohalidivorans DSM 14336]